MEHKEQANGGRHNFSGQEASGTGHEHGTRTIPVPDFSLAGDRPSVDFEGTELSEPRTGGLPCGSETRESTDNTEDALCVDVVRAGRPLGSTYTQRPAKRVNTAKKGVTNCPQEVLFNPSLSDMDVRIYMLVKTLQWTTGWCYMSQRGMAKELYPDRNKQYYRKVGKSLNRLVSAGYLRRRYMRGDKGKRFEHQTVDLRKGKAERNLKERITAGYEMLKSGEMSQNDFDNACNKLTGKNGYNWSVSDNGAITWDGG